MNEQRKERTIDELVAENDALRKKAEELNKEIEYLQHQVDFLKKSVRQSFFIVRWAVPLISRQSIMT